MSGKIQALNVSEEYEPDEFDFEVSMSSDETPERRRVKEMVRKAGVEALRAKLSEWHKALRIEFTKGMILPTKDKAAKTTSSSSSSGVRIHSESQDAKADSSSSSGGGAGARGKFEIAEQFLCTPADLYQCFLDENRVRAYTQADASIAATIGGEFSLFGGNVTGVFKDLIPNERIVQAWRFKSWPEGVFSEVVMKLSPGDGCTHLNLTHSNVPEADMERAKEGWSRLQFDRIKAVFGFGTSLAGLV